MSHEHQSDVVEEHPKEFSSGQVVSIKGKSHTVVCDMLDGSVMVRLDGTSKSRRVNKSEIEKKRR